MEYEHDTLTSADRNRAASKKLFQQWVLSSQQSARVGNAMALQQASSSSTFSDHNQSMAAPAQTSVGMSHSNSSGGGLHRSPSGAQKKIRQRRDERSQQLLQQSRENSISSVNSSPSSTTTISAASSGNSTLISEEIVLPSVVDYRSLVELDSYRSILPDDSWKTRDLEEFSMRFTDSSHNRSPSLDKPARPPRTSDFARPKFSSSSWDDTEKSTVSQTTNGYDHNPSCTSNSTNGYLGKPTVQVHPMPALKLGSLSSSSSSISPPDTLKKQPPPVPKKPISQLSKKLADSGIRNESLNEIPPPTFFWTSKTAKSPSISLNGNKSMMNSSMSALEAKEKHQSSKFNHQLASSMHSSNTQSPGLNDILNAPNTLSSAESLPSLLSCSSPSLLSLQTSLTHAYNNPELHTNEQLEQLERRRLDSIQSLSKKAYERELDRQAVTEELDQVDQIRVSIFKTLGAGSGSANDTLLSRLNVHILQGERLTELETRLQLQIEKLENRNQQTNRDASHDNEGLQWRRRLSQQLDDIAIVRASYNARDEELDRELCRLISRSLFLEWRFYKDSMLKLNVEMKQIDSKLQNVRNQLEALETMGPVATSGRNSQIKD
ncbi:hypothetical protein DdX_01292 [Ditylenchus destructor]|uniref:ASD2 domain-containing protein n=1 Tax=Ditylenchus destructor TaxID=166010 RepID=A0AAD4NLB9_9BILA|nr:hypothetical protein DdX_01292 [Ditylenchus destructor]